MDVAVVARNMGIRDMDVIRKAEELVRMAKVKIPGGLGPGEVCKAAICLELACTSSSHVVPPSREMFVRHGCASKKVYITAFGLCQKVLDLGTVAPTVAELALKCGCENLTKPAETLLALYRKRFLEQLKQQHQQQGPLSGSAQATTSSGTAQVTASTPSTSANTTTANFNRPAFAVAALQLTASAQGWGRGQVKVDARKLLSQLGVPWSQYQPVADSMRELCAAELGLQPATAGDSPGSRSGPHASVAEEGAVEDDQENQPGNREGAKGKGKARAGRRKGTVTSGVGKKKAGGGGASNAAGKRKAARKRQAVSESEDESAGSGGEGDSGVEECDEWCVVGRAGQDGEGLGAVDAGDPEDVGTRPRKRRARAAARLTQ